VRAVIQSLSTFGSNEAAGEPKTKMKLAKKYTHYINRWDRSGEKITPYASLEEAKQGAQVRWEIAHYTDKPKYDICERDGTVVARLVDGNIESV
jgi:hypothetical protein